jgi:regulator of protease activity HflC (stomatin/prohibitin superfamily)
MSEQVDDLVERLRSRAWEHRQHRQLREAAAAEITALRAENEVHRKSIGAYGIAQARAEAAEAALAAAKEDAERMEWLESTQSQIERFSDGRVAVCWVYPNPNGYQTVPTQDTLRAAIDAARKQPTDAGPP